MEFRRSGDLDEALTSLAELGDKAQVLAGGTDVMIQLERGEISPETLVHIERVEGMRDIAENGRLTLGALVTHIDLAQSPVLCDRYQSVAHAASLVGGWQTQAVGTIGGNVCNASQPPIFYLHSLSMTQPFFWSAKTAVNAKCPSAILLSADEPLPANLTN